ncbi:peptidyl-glycine alpha-amidating monooxygenase B-like [Diadema antillarum]|uniref:peptidyl-glycine alpha-amidating monooxygenase B-like n=1 Tax=Diadema antillarum TaxID=105358 RepID=UPI003A8AD26B
MASVQVVLQALSMVMWHLLSVCEARYPYNTLTGSRMQYPRQETDDFTMDILMPGVIPKMPEEYLCYAEAAPYRDSYIVNFEPRASMKTIHHMLVYGCRELRDDRQSVVQCSGSPCKGNSNILFGWARDAPSPNIPRGVGFHVGGSSGINYLMIQLHYGDNLDHLKGTEGDHSGITLRMTHTPQPFIGGIYLLWSSNINVPPHSTNVHSDIACMYDSSANIHPFAFRTHAHSLGKVITGYLIRDGEWTVIAQGDPQWPQAFYPSLNDYTVRPGDILAARCTYDSNRDVAVHVGGTHNDEMCNLYLMYYTDSIHGKPFQECGQSPRPHFFDAAPSGYDSRPSHPKYSTAQEVHSRLRPPVDNIWDPFYNYDNRGEYYTGGEQSYLREGSNNDYLNPLQEGDEDTMGGASLGGGGREEEEEMDGGGRQGVTEGPDKTIDETGSLVTAGQELRVGEGEATPSGQAAETGSGTSSPIAEDKTIPSLTVTDVAGWPSENSDVTLGQVSGVAVDSHGNVHVFHRASRPWDLDSFDEDHFLQASKGPISENTLVKYDSTTGQVISQWGANQFYLPHGLTIDHEDNVWLTDVAMHQVFKYPAGGGNSSLLTLGIKLEPGKDRNHFCKPSDVTVDPKTGNFFVSDGYCNARIVKFSPTGEFLTEWGHLVKASALNPPVGQFNIPHSITMVTDKDHVCVADREVGRIQCFESGSGDFVKQFNLPEFGGRLYAVVYTSASGGLLYAVNGPSYGNNPVRGFALNYTSGEILTKWSPTHQEFEKPHDITCTPDGKLVYVAEIGPNKVWKFVTNAEFFDSVALSKAFETQSVTPEISQAQTVSEASTPSTLRNLSQPVPVSPSAHSIPTVEVDNMTQSVTGNSSTFRPSSYSGLQSNASGLGDRLNSSPGDANMGTTTIIVAVFAVPILLMLLVTVAIRMHAQGHFRLNKKRRNYKVSAGDKFSLGSLLHKRNGFSQVATEDSDHDGGQWSEESDIEEYSILNNFKRTQNL